MLPRSFARVPAFRNQKLARYRPRIEMKPTETRCGFAYYDTGLRFSVGPWVYSLRICDHGCRASFEDRAIYLGANVKPGERRDALAHELYHCWEFHTPAPHDEEERARLAATVSEAMFLDLERQGGSARLRAIQTGGLCFHFRPGSTEFGRNGRVITT